MSLAAGELRPSQAVTQSGPGSLVDLPTLSMIIAGTDQWNLNYSRRVDEPRLARHLGVDVFREPPYLNRAAGLGGVPARIFPEYLICPQCSRLAPHQAFEFDASRRRHVCRAPTCKGQGRALAYPARFMVACSKGHLDDFPWHAYIHKPDVQCSAELQLEDSGQTGAITDLWVKCLTHNASKNLGQAFGIEGRKRLPNCAGRRPWLADFDPINCTEQLRVLLRGASNAYFAVVESALSIPPWSDPIQVALGGYFELLANIQSLEDLQTWLRISNVPELADFKSDRLWEAMLRRRDGYEEQHLDLKAEEWRAFQAGPLKIDSQSEFKSRTVPVPSQLAGFLGRLVLLERLREVRALRGFTRIDPVPDVGDLDEVEAVRAGLAPISRTKKRWLPGTDFRGEGVLLQLDEARLTAWESRDDIRDLNRRFEGAQEAWHAARRQRPNAYHPIRYVVLHGLAHLLMRQLSLDCGYSSASLRERIYCRNAGDESMAGILIYTATADSEGSLGGLVEMGQPAVLGPMLSRALHNAQLCANDPLCADGGSTLNVAHLNGAACHACLLLSETACEAGNHYLDRGLLVATLRGAGSEYIAS